MLRQASRICISQARGFHTTATNFAFKKKAGDANSASIFKRGTPQRSKGWIGNFKDTAAYSRLGKEAPKAKEEDIKLMQLDSLNAGSIVQYPPGSVKSMGVLGSFKRGQRHELFKDRTTLIRQSTTLPIADLIHSGTKSSSKNNRVCLLGDRGTGKSTVLSQAHSLALLNGYVVLHVPRARELISGDSDAVWHEKSQSFTQPMYVRQWIKRIAKGNKPVLSSINYSSGKNPTSLYDYMMSHKNDKDIHTVMNTIMEQLEKSSESHPVLFTFDDINIFNEFTHSKNVDAQGRNIYHGRLQVPRLFLDYLSGAKEFKNGAIVASVTGATRLNETIPVGLGIVEQATAYAKIDRFDPRLSECFKGVKPLKVERYSREETQISLDYWSSVKVIPEATDVSESFVDQKYLVSGNGNPRELLSACTQLY